MIKREIKVGIIGYGIVGKSTVKTIIDNANVIKLKTGINISVKGVADLNINRRDDEYSNNIAIKTQNGNDLINDKEIDIIVELIGGTGVAKDFILKSINAGKHIVTANKALLAKHGKEIFTAAKDKNVIVAFEASVGGGIPIIRVMKEDLVANNITEIYGIINGTSNFILSKMSSEGRSFDDVLRDAQENGYAEADPTFDIEGIDAAHKITLLSSIAFSTYTPFDKVFTEGIKNIKQLDIEIAREFNSTIKLLAIAKKTDKGIDIRVHPTIIPNDNMLASVDGVFNAVMITGDKVGNTLHYGKGAGGSPTSSAVVADVVSIARDIVNGSKSHIPSLGFVDEEEIKQPMIPIEEIFSSFYLRFTVADKIGVLATICKILADNDISVSKAIQRESTTDNNTTPLVFMTHSVKGEKIIRAIKEIDNLDITAEESVVIRVEV